MYISNILRLSTHIHTLYHVIKSLKNHRIMSYDSKIGKSICDKIRVTKTSSLFLGWEDPEKSSSDTVRTINAILTL